MIAGNLGDVHDDVVCLTAVRLAPRQLERVKGHVPYLIFSLPPVSPQNVNDFMTSLCFITYRLSGIQRGSIMMGSDYKIHVIRDLAHSNVLFYNCN